MATKTDQTPAPALKPGEANEFAAMLLQAASDLHDEKATVMQKIAANRETLRNMRVMQMMDADQASAVEEWYPTVERKKKGDGGGETFAAKEVRANADAA